MPKRKIILRQKLAVGDAVILTALCRDIHACYPGDFDVVVDPHFREIFSGHPHARLFGRGDDAAAGPVTDLRVSYKEGIAAAGRGNKVHMLAWYHRDFARKTGLDVYPTLPKGDLHLTEAEKVPLVPGRYWLVMAGGKTDITCKLWLPSRWQAVVDGLADRGVRCVQAGGNFRRHHHPKLRCESVVGRFPSARQFFNLVYNADGVICPVTAAMHIAACFDKPCVVLGGGREEPWWENYANADPSTFGPRCAPVAVEHRFLHTIGKLDCCRDRGCWKHRTQPLNDGAKYDAPHLRCKLPVVLAEGATPKCMEMLTPQQVIDAVMSYAPVTSAVTPVTPEVTAPITVESPPEPSAAVPAPNSLLAAIRNPHVAASPPRPAQIDHPILGGRVTVFVCCHGDYPGLVRTCLSSVADTLPGDCYDLRVIQNATSPAVDAVVRAFAPAADYAFPENRRKYPAMRAAFFDPARPIRTKYVVWLDEDVRINSAATWPVLFGKVVAHHPSGGRLFGNAFVHDPLQFARRDNPDPMAWFRDADWWRGRDLPVGAGAATAPNGTKVPFVAGWFWALCAAAIKECDVPDRRLGNNGDMVIGAQVYQHGFKIVDVGNRDKSLAWTPPREAGGRRGAADPFPWSLPNAGLPPAVTRAAV